MRPMTFAIGFVSLALAVSASALAQTSTDTTGKKTSAFRGRWLHRLVRHP
jgi:hypothetical protein